MKKITVTATILIAGTAVAAFAHVGATRTVKERMDAMLAMGKAVKAVAPMMQGETPYDAETVRDAARLFQQHAGENMTKLFPEGTGGMPSEAKDEVWTEWDRFAALATQRHGTPGADLRRTRVCGSGFRGQAHRKRNPRAPGGTRRTLCHKECRGQDSEFRHLAEPTFGGQGSGASFSHLGKEGAERPGSPRV